MLAYELRKEECEICKEHGYLLNKETREAIEEGRRLAKDPNAPRYKTMAEFIAAVEA